MPSAASFASNCCCSFDQPSIFRISVTLRSTSFSTFRTDKINKKEILRTLFKQSDWLVNVPSFESRSYKYDSGKKYAWCICSEDIADIDDDPIDIEGGCNNNYKGSMITYQNIRKCLCYDCFIQYNDELSKKYNVTHEYAFIEDC